MPNVFVYGTLLIPEMMKVLIDRTAKSSPAKLLGFKRRQLSDCIYPAIVPQQREQVIGKVYFELNEIELARLDYFEGPEYSRQTVSLAVDQVGNIEAETYVLEYSEYNRLTSQDWDLNRFHNTNLKSFLAVARSAMQCYDSANRSRKPRRTR